MSHNENDVHRERSLSTPSKYGTLVLYQDGVNVGEYTTLLSSYENVMQDILTDRFFQRIADGEIIINDMSVTGTTVENTVGSWSNYNFEVPSNPTFFETGGDGSVIQWMLDLPLEISSSIDPPSYNETDMVSMAKLIAIANIDPSDFEFAEDTGEIRETLRLLRHPFRSLFELSRDFKRSRKKRYAKSYSRRRRETNASRMAKATAETYLEYRFGIIPLVRTISSLYQDMTLAKIKKPLRKTSRGYENFNGENSEHCTDKNGFRDFLKTREVSVDVRAGIIYELKHQLSDWRQHYGFRNKDLLRTAWDLVPFSFVVDRVVNIGNGITALTNLSDENISILGGWVSIRKDDSVIMELLSQTEAGHTFTISNCKQTRTTKSYSRGSWVPNVFDVVPPVVPGGLVKDATKIADLAALVYSNFR
jgi:hypothetical protein